MIDDKLSPQRAESRAKVIFEFDYYENRDEIECVLKCSEAYSDLNEIYNLVRSQLKHGDEELSPKIESLLLQIRELAYRDF